MSTDRKRRVGVAGAVVVLGASALVQTNGGLISSAMASHDDESPKESLAQKAAVQKPMQAAQPAVQQAAPLKPAAQSATPTKKSTTPATTSPPK